MVLLYFFFTVLAWGLVQFYFFRPDSIVNDWMGWRESDTQSIALNFLKNKFNIFYPEVNWAGPVNAFIETEFQLYAALIALIMKVVGPAEWPGQIISLLSIMMSSVVMFFCLHKRFSLYASTLGALSLLTFRGVIFLSTSVQPDAFAFLFFTLSFSVFLDYLDNPCRRTLLWYVLWTALAGLIKPTTLSIGVAQAIMAVLINGKVLRRPSLWMAWLLILAIVAAYLLHGAYLYKTYGYTFGILSGGDSKSPKAEHLIIPWLYKDLIKQAILWGVNILGVMGAAYLLVRGKIKEVEMALAVSYGMLCLAAMRYMHDEFGEHYHIYAVILSVWLFAKMLDDLEKICAQHKFMHRALILSSLVLIGGHYAYQAKDRLSYNRDDLSPILSFGEEMKKVIPPGEVIVVRSSENSYNKFWRTINNFEDPRLFYISETKGWIMANDHFGTDVIEARYKAGAHYYVEVFLERKNKGEDPAFYQWLQAHGEPLLHNEKGMIYRFSQP